MKTIKCIAMIMALGLFTASCGNKTNTSSSSSVDSSTNTTMAPASPSPDPGTNMPDTVSHTTTTDTTSNAK